MPQLFRRPRTLLAVLIALVAFVAIPVTSAVAHGHRHHGPTIAQVRAMPLGATVTVEGTVTTPAGVFDSSFFDVGFAIQDRTAGIFVSFPDPDQTLQPLRKAQPFRHVEVTGVLEDDAGLLVIAPASTEDVNVKGKDDPIASEWVHTGSVGESTEGSIVRAVGMITDGPIPDEPFGNKFILDDGSGPITVYVNNGAHTDISHLAVGQLISATGFSTEFKDATTDHYEIDIRSRADLEQPVR
jgi:hypothetical protein